MRLISLSIVLVLLSSPTAEARNVVGYLRQDTRRSTLMEQHLIDDSTESQVNKESRFLKEEQEPRKLLSPWCLSTTPVMWHPDYSDAWSDGGCTLKADCDSPGYSTQVECCQAAYGGQISGACIKGLPMPPTFSGAAGKWYADQGPAWSNGGCTNTIPYPIYAAVFFDTQLSCCKGAFGGQMSGACINGLANPPTAAPTTIGGVGGKWYADYGTSWPTAGCKNTTPYPIYAGIFYDSQLLCCKGAFAGQQDNACFKGLANPPTAAPTNVAELNGGWYANYSTSWSIAGCTNTLPRPSFAIIIYATQLACCKGAFGGQTSKACIKSLPNPPTIKPTPTPTSNPTRSPTTTMPASPPASPSNAPTTSNPTTATPTASPSKFPSSSPSDAPTTSEPTTATPTASPSDAPTTSKPTTATPTASPSDAPTTSEPTTATPTASPSDAPTTSEPTTATPTTASPTKSPTTNSPTMKPTVAPIVWPVSTFLPNSPTVPQAQWYYSGMAGNATATLVTLQTEVQNVSNTLVSGAPGSIVSALRLYTRPLQNIDKAEVGMHFYDTGLFNGMKFKDMVAGGITFEYSYFKASVSGGNQAAAPAIKVVVYKPPISNPTNWTTFVYEPYLNGPNPTNDVWQSKIADTTTGTSTPLTANSGGMGWRQTRWSPYKNSECRSLTTWADYFNTTMPDVYNDAIVGSVSIGVGSYNPGVTSYVNSLRIAVGDYDWKWTFGI